MWPFRPRRLKFRRLVRPASIARTADRLEPRTLLSTIQSAGVEALSIATSSIDFESAVASNSSGTFVVVATSQGGGADGDGFGLSARVFDSNGVATTARFQVNTTTAGTQFRPDVAMDASGNFVVVWQGGDDGGNGQDSDGSVGIYGQRFNGLGQKIGSEFQTHNFITGDQVRPAVAMAPDGRFVVVWQDDFGLDTDSSGIFGRLYNADGTANGAEFQINGQQNNSDFFGSQVDPDVAMDASGNFAVTWHNFGTALRLRRFTAAGVSTTNEVDVILNPSNLAQLPRIGMDADGDVVVAWEQFNRDGDGFSNRNIYARRYSTNLTPQPLGPDFLVNSTTTSDQEQAAVSMAPGGTFLLSWQSADQDGSLDGIFAQLYNSDGSPGGNEFRVNTTTTNDQRQPEIAFGSNTQAVITWYGLGVGNPLDVYHQRYSVTAPVIPDDTTVSVDGQNRLLITDTGTATNDRLTVTLNMAGDVVIVDPNARLGTTIAGAVLSPDAHTLTVPRSRFGTFVQADLRNGFDKFDASQLPIQTRVFAGAGNDLILTGMLDDSVNAGIGNDTVRTGNGDDTVNGSDGNDVVFAESGRDSLFGEAGNDRLFGGDGYDTISGGVGSDVLRGGRGEDRLSGDSGQDELFGDDHNDVLLGGDGADTVFAGDGADTVFAGAGFDVVDGGAGNDRLFGETGNDTISGGSGDDFVRGGQGADRLSGDQGQNEIIGDQDNDTLIGGNFSDTLSGGDGNDRIFAAGGFDLVDGGNGDDELYGQDGNDTLRGANGRDLLRGGTGHDVLNGDGGFDTLFGDQGDDTIRSGDGNDTVFAGSGRDSVLGNDGNDRLFGNDGYDTMSGGEGDDFLRGGRGQDLLSGDGGNDTLVGDEHDDTLFGGVGNDSLLSGDGNDRVFGDAGTDFIRGEAGNDQLFGGDDSDTILGDSGNDLLRGGNGNDSIEGGSGSDTVHGDSGADTIDVEESPNPDGIDTIVNVEVSDTIFKDPNDLMI